MSVALKIVEKSTCFEIHEEFFQNFTSLHTRKSYKSDLMHFLNFLNELPESVDNYYKIERQHVVTYRNYLQELGGIDNKGAAPKTIARKLAAISSYFDFLVETSQMPFNPVTSVKRPRREVKTPTNALTADQVEELLEAINRSTLSGKMHFALIVMFFTTGLRKSEILYLKRSSYREINNFTVVEYKGKGGKIGQKLLHPDAVDALETYLDEMKNQGRTVEGEDWLFQPTRNPSNPKELNKPLNPKTINEIMTRYGKKIGLNFNISPHSARATFIGELLNSGIDIYKVAQEVNHSSVRTTQEYDKRIKHFYDSPIMKLNYKKRS
jgi:site-specific recombinase XerD